jgi:hypothetical protein
VERKPLAAYKYVLTGALSAIGLRMFAYRGISVTSVATAPEASTKRSYAFECQLQNACSKGLAQLVHPAKNCISFHQTRGISRRSSLFKASSESVTCLPHHREGDGARLGRPQPS